MAKIAKDEPLSEITLRRYEKPNLNDRALVRKLFLAVELLQPGDSRDVIVDVLYVLLKNKKEMNSEQVREKVIEFRKEKNLEMLGIASSNIRRQLKRLRDLMLIEKRTNSYRVTENLTMKEILKEKIERFYLPSIIERVEEYFDAIDREFSK